MTFSPFDHEYQESSNHRFAGQCGKCGHPKDWHGKERRADPESLPVKRMKAFLKLCEEEDAKKRSKTR